MKSDICIVVIGYNRDKSLSRCLNRLNECRYNSTVDLYISIDNSTVNTSTTLIAENFNWKNGNKTTILHNKRLGLKLHVLTCGDIINKKDYHGIIMLEDDIYVADDYFYYVKQCLDKYDNSEEIAGISLYKHDWNINSKLPFYPIYEGKDVYFMQYAQSWGQAWSKRMWNEFREWLNDNDEWNSSDTSLPMNVLKWPESSWLKYFIKYCNDTKKFFVYPYFSLSTNFSDIGEHNQIKNNSMQRQLSTSINYEYRLVNINETRAIYDCFFENLYLRELFDYDDLTIDLYGKKNHVTRYILTTKKLNFKILKEFGLNLKPIELNVINKIKGTGIFLYDTQVLDITNKSKYGLMDYFWVEFDIIDSLKLLIKKIISRLH